MFYILILPGCSIIGRVVYNDIFNINMSLIPSFNHRNFYLAIVNFKTNGHSQSFFGGVMVSMLGNRESSPGRVRPKTINWYLFFGFSSKHAQLRSKSQAFQYGVVPGTFTHQKWSFVLDFKECCIRYS